jgi:hypothetical protein
MAQNVPTAWDVWKAFVVDGLQSKLGIASLLALLAIAIWRFSTGDILGGVVVLALAAFHFARVPAAIGILVGMRAERAKRGRWWPYTTSR